MTAVWLATIGAALWVGYLTGRAARTARPRQRDRWELFPRGRRR